MEFLGFILLPDKNKEKENYNNKNYLKKERKLSLEFEGSVEKYPTKIQFDTGADHSYISDRFSSHFPSKIDVTKKLKKYHLLMKIILK